MDTATVSPSESNRQIPQDVKDKIKAGYEALKKAFEIFAYDYPLKTDSYKIVVQSIGDIERENAQGRKTDKSHFLKVDGVEGYIYLGCFDIKTFQYVNINTSDFINPTSK